MRYAVVIEKGEGNYSAYVPDLPGCVDHGGHPGGGPREMREAIEFHLDGMREDGLPVPKPTQPGRRTSKSPPSFIPPPPPPPRAR